jgi:hypothetical protein
LGRSFTYGNDLPIVGIHLPRGLMGAPQDAGGIDGL